MKCRSGHIYPPCEPSVVEEVLFCLAGPRNFLSGAMSEVVAQESNSTICDAWGSFPGSTKYKFHCKKEGLF